MKIYSEARHVGPCANYIRALLRPRSVDYNRACLSSCADCAMSIYMLLSSHFRACAATTVMVFVFVVVVAVAVCRFRCRCRSSCFVVDSRATIAAQNDANHVRKSHDKSARTWHKRITSRCEISLTREKHVEMKPCANQNIWKWKGGFLIFVL